MRRMTFLRNFPCLIGCSNEPSPTRVLRLTSVRDSVYKVEDMMAAGQVRFMTKRKPCPLITTLHARPTNGGRSP